MSQLNPIRHRKSKELERAFKDEAVGHLTEYSCFGGPNFSAECYLDCPLGESCLRFKQDKVKEVTKYDRGN